MSDQLKTSQFRSPAYESVHYQICEQLSSAIRIEQVVLQLWPPQSPDCNIRETVCDYMKRHRQPNSTEELREVVQGAWNDLPAKYLETLQKCNEENWCSLTTKVGHSKYWSYFFSVYRSLNEFMNKKFIHGIIFESSSLYSECLKLFHSTIQYILYFLQVITVRGLQSGSRHQEINEQIVKNKILHLEITHL